MFKNTLKNIKQFIPLLLIIFLLSFAVSYFVTAFIHNNYFSYYEAKVTTNEDIDKIYNLDYLKSLEEDIKNYNNDAKTKGTGTIYYSSTTNYENIYNNSKIDKYDGYFLILVKCHVFETTQLSSNGRISEGIEKFSKTMNSIFNNSLRDNDSYNLDDNFEIINHQNPYIISSISSSALFLIILTLIIILSLLNKIKPKEKIYNNVTIYKTPFHKSYIKSSLSHFKNVKDIVMIALLFSMMLALKALKLPSGFGSLGLNFVFLAFAIIGMLYGPVVGIVIGFFSDILGFFLFPSGYGFFFPYTIDSMITGLCYGICFYKTRLSLSKCFYARLFVNLFVNVFCGSIWWSIINGFTYEAYLNYMLVISLPKNLIYLVPQTALLFIILKPASKVASNFSLVDKEIYDNFGII